MDCLLPVPLLALSLCSNMMTTLRPGRDNCPHRVKVLTTEVQAVSLLVDQLQRLRTHMNATQGQSSSDDDKGEGEEGEGEGEGEGESEGDTLTY